MQQTMLMSIKTIWRRWIGRRMTDGRATLQAWQLSITERCPSVDHWQIRTRNPALELSKPENPGLEKTAGFVNSRTDVEKVVSKISHCSLLSTRLIPIHNWGLLKICTKYHFYWHYLYTELILPPTVKLSVSWTTNQARHTTRSQLCHITFWHTDEICNLCFWCWQLAHLHIINVIWLIHHR